MKCILTEDGKETLVGIGVVIVGIVAVIVLGFLLIISNLSIVDIAPGVNMIFNYIMVGVINLVVLIVSIFVIGVICSIFWMKIERMFCCKKDKVGDIK